MNPFAAGLALLTFLLISPQGEAQQTSNRIRVGELVLVDRKINMQFQIVVDELNTAYFMAMFANGDHRLLRISEKGAVKQPVLYRGWPYIVDKRGRLLAMDVSWGAILENKTPVMLKRLLTKFPFAAGAGFGMFALGWLHGFFEGTFSSNFQSPEDMAAAGFISFYLGDAFVSAFFRSPRQLHGGGNYFKTLLAKNVVGVDESSNHKIIYKWADPTGRRKSFLEELEPEYAQDSHCMLYLTRMVY